MNEDINARIDGLKARFANLDLEGKIAAHPIAALGVALATGALIGLATSFGRTSKVDTEVAAKSTIGGAISGAITALAMRMVKDYALGRLSGAAKTWYSSHNLEDQGSQRERGASRDASVERFLEH